MKLRKQLINYLIEIPKYWDNSEKFFLFGGIILVLVFAGFMYNRFRVTQKQNLLIEQQKHIIEEKHKEVLDSIRYAKRIQDALITPISYIDRNIKRLKGL